MGQKIGFFFLSVLVSILFGFGLVYYFGGIKEYIQAIKAINNLGVNEIDKASQIFYGTGGKNEYRGMLRLAPAAVLGGGDAALSISNMTINLRR